MNHMVDARTAGSPRPRWRWPTSRRPASTWASRSTTWCWRSPPARCGSCCCATTVHADHPLLASVPVSFDFSRDRISGNYFTGVMMALPVEIADPLERVRAAHDAAVSAKESHQLIGPELVSRWSAYFPPAPAEALFALAGQQGRPEQGAEPAHLQRAGPARARPRRRRAGHRDLLGGSADGGQRPEHHRVELRRPAQHLGAVRRRHASTTRTRLTDAMVEAFVEIRRAAGLSEELTVVETAMAQA